jgi:hypothetical protein
VASFAMRETVDRQGKFLVVMQMNAGHSADRLLHSVTRPGFLVELEFLVPEGQIRAGGVVKHVERGRGYGKFRRISNGKS